jgi:hypothetical protein
LIYPAGRLFPNDTNFAITVRNDSAHARKSVVTFSLPNDVELSAAVANVSCRTTGPTVVCKHRVSDYWETVPAHRSVTYNVFLDHRDVPGRVKSMPMPRVETDPRP